MRQLTGWHYFVIATIPLGIFLGLLFGLLGLAVFTLFNLLLCSYSPDLLLFKKRPDAVHRFSKKQFYSGGSSSYLMPALAIIFVPVPATFIVWIFSPQDISNFILSWPSLGVVNDNLTATLSYITYPSIINPDFSAKTLDNLELMNRHHLRLSLYAIVCRLLIYIGLPIVIVLSTFDRTRAARSGYAFRASRNFSEFARILTAIVLMCIFLLLDMALSVPYLSFFREGRGAPLRLIICPIITVFIFWAILELLDQFMSRPQTYHYKHETDYELYLQRRDGSKN